MSYTVRPLGQGAFQSEIPTLRQARAAKREAEQIGLVAVAIIDDATGYVVAPSDHPANDRLRCDTDGHPAPWPGQHVGAPCWRCDRAREVTL